ncbi:hypothetical protein NQ176_g2577 [Zarea fungicola]|uniref:Uncharacterized protein n=1 Tax=Zarea fungicola TaxID=93591 RepID=A0ACC1NP04_9HYPO|nr:hypothetical protein NQ176_g2577 [Lecanicillium fungicola]
MKSLIATLLALLASKATIFTSATKIKADFPGGSVVGTSAHGVETFNGIPFAEAPVGDLRLRPPKRYTDRLDNYDATGVAAACPQLYISNETTDLTSKLNISALNIPFLDRLNGQEDCLTVSIQRPIGTRAGDDLPVLFWIYGGGFTLGATNTYDATSLLTSAVSQGQPFVFVSVNYRINGFGFLPGKEILAEGAANIGLLDQRMALEWVADNIQAFGGAASKVTLWGESAGAMSGYMQMLLFDGNATYNGKELFRGLIMDSGSIISAERVDSAKAQRVYDSVVQHAGCDRESDTLQCLRQLPYENFYKAVTSQPGFLSYSSAALSYPPRSDGVVLVDSPEVMTASGRMHKVPYILGDQEDEGTLFSLFQSNITTTDSLVDYLSDLFFWRATKKQIRALVELYPTSISDGSPFRTGGLNELYPGFKRLAALLGDVTFTLTRRIALRMYNTQAPETPTWSYLASYDHAVPILGTYHAGDIGHIFLGILPSNSMKSCRTYYFNFLYNLDPNKGVGGYANWPRWSDKQQLMWFKTDSQNDILDDNFRESVANLLAQNSSLYQI